MNKFFSNTLTLCLIVLVVFGIASVALAQTDTYVNTSLFVTDVTLDRETYAPGEEVTGSFIIHNTNNFGVNDANYVISLAADYVVGGVPSNIIETSDRIDIPFLEEGTKEIINFSYDIPVVIGGNNFGINIRAVLDSGVELGWGDARFNLSGESLSLVEIKTASFKLLDQSFRLGTGPTVYSEDGAVMLVTLHSSEELSLTPRVKIKAQFDNEIVYSRELESIQMPIGDFEYEFILPTEFSPGVYLGEMEMLDSSGVNRISKLEFRYIIGGQIGTIQGIYTDSNEVAKGETLGVDVNVTGTPFDIVRNSAKEYSGNAKLEVTIKDRLSGKTIGGEAINIVDLRDKTYNLDIIINANTANIDVEAILYGSDSQILDEYSVSQPEGEMPESKSGILISILTIFSALVVLLIIGLIVKKRKMVIQEQ